MKKKIPAILLDPAPAVSSIYLFFPKLLITPKSLTRPLIMSPLWKTHSFPPHLVLLDPHVTSGHLSLHVFTHSVFDLSYILSPPFLFYLNKVMGSLILFYLTHPIKSDILFLLRSIILHWLNVCACSGLTRLGEMLASETWFVKLCECVIWGAAWMLEWNGMKASSGKTGSQKCTRSQRWCAKNENEH